MNMNMNNKDKQYEKYNSIERLKSENIICLYIYNKSSNNKIK